MTFHIVPAPTAVLCVVIGLATSVFASDHPGLPTVSGVDAPKIALEVAKDWSPQVIHLPSTNDYYKREKRTCAGVASMAISRGGRLWVAWYTGITPGAKIETCPKAYVVVSTSGDGGTTWQEVLAIDPDAAGPLKAMDPRPWIDPQGRIWIVWHVTINGVSYKFQTKKAWAITAGDSDAADPSWSSPRFITSGVLLNKPIVLTSGEWLFAAHDRLSIDDGLLKAVVSADSGQTFGVSGQLTVSHDVHAIEPMAVERHDGSLWMLTRTGTYPFAEHGLYESISTDRGSTWSPLKLPNIKHTTSRFYIGRLQSGCLLLVKHSGIDVEPLSVGKKQRRELTAFLSKDDGQSWSSGLVVDDRIGCSYPDAQQTTDGTIYLTWDFNRTKDQEIMLTTFREEDVLSTSAATQARIRNNRKLINQRITR